MKRFRHFTNTITIENYGNELRNKWDFTFVLKVCGKLNDATSAGKLFHVRAAATGNARSPTVDSCV